MTISETMKRARTAYVVIAGDDVYEDLFTASVELQDILALHGFATRVRIGTVCLADTGAAVGLDDPDGPDLIVLYRASGAFTAAERAALSAAVGRGAGLLAVHSSAVIDDDPALAALLGVRYLDHGPQPHESRFAVVTNPHPITDGIEPFEVDHEHYRLAVASGVEVIAHRETGSTREPLVTAHRFGRGRVCFVQLGHDMRVWAEPGVRSLISRAADWLTPSSIHDTESEDRTA